MTSRQPRCRKRWYPQRPTSHPRAIRSLQSEGFEIGISTGNFRANSKALAEGSGDGLAKVIFRKDNYEVIAVHIIGLHAADLIQERQQ